MKSNRLLGATALLSLSVFWCGMNVPASLAATPADQLILGASLAQVLSLDPGQATEPGAATILANAYDRLVTTDNTDPTKVLPQLAESWDIEPDAVVFHLRDAKFQSGNPVTAEDVVWSFSRVLEMNQASASILKQFGFSTENVSSLISAVDPRTVRIGLPPQATATSLLYTLTGTTGSIVDKKTALAHETDGDRANGWLRVNSAGSGPFRLARWSPNEMIVLERNDDYWGQKPAMKRVLMRHLPESQVQRLQLTKGDLDVGLALSAKDIMSFEGNKDFQIQQLPAGGFYALAMNCQNPYLSNPDVRRAIAWAIDYDGIAKSIMGPYGRVRQMPVPINFPGALPDPGYKLDVAKAKEYLAKAGYPDGFPLVLKTIAETPRVDLATALQASLGQIGITVSIEQGNGSQIIAAHRGRQFDLLLPQTGNGLPTGVGALSDFAHNPDNSEKGNPGYFAWRSACDIPDINKLYEQAMGERDDAKQTEMVKELQQMIVDAAPAVLPMFERFTPIVVSARLQGFYGQGFRGTRFETVTKAE